MAIAFKSGAALVLASGILHAAASDPPRSVIQLTAAAVWADIEQGAIQGRPARLAWADDRTTLYLQTVTGNTRESLAFYHYLIHKGARPARVDKQPPWAEAYWRSKSARNLGGDPQLTIAVDTTRELQDNLNGIASNKTVFLTDSPIGLTGQALALAKQPGQAHTVNRMRLKGQIIGEFVDELIVPGYTFSWSPEDMRKIAFRSQAGHLTIMDDEGRTELVADTTDVILPAWSEDGAAIAYLERSHHRFALCVVEVMGR